MKNSIIIAMALVLLTATGAAEIALAQEQLTEHTFKLNKSERRPAATLSDVSWLVGSWSGSGFGGTFEETWNPPSMGSMIGFFKLYDDDQVAFYELLLLVEEEGSLSLKVKHFNADFTAWEDKEDYVTFRFISADEDAIHFSGISFYRINADTLHAYLVMRSGEDIREEMLVYHRQ
ncbi:MAG: DUF6265 family protein [Gammaproteobacteria bacterium]|nr:DUF6265 family protein [Gammaproteobacteria bacterium]